MKQYESIFRTWIAIAIALLVWPVSFGQTFESGSNGSDGALDLTTPGTVIFNPITLGLDPDGDHIFHFTTINIGADVILVFRSEALYGPIFWLASGAVQIDGVLDLDGEPGQDGIEISNFGSRRPAEPGAGGFAGGIGGLRISYSGGQLSTPSHAGFGPGGGQATSNHGWGAGHARVGSGGGAAYGSPFVVPLVGGSGGGGGSYTGCGGGAGGGAILIASSVSIAINGTIQAKGGRGGDCASSYYGGGGSGGAIRLAAPSIAGSGSLLVTGGSSTVYIGSEGRIRLEAFVHNFTGTAELIAPLASPYSTHLPQTPPPRVVVTAIDGNPIINPTGDFIMPDVEIASIDPVDIEIQASQIPVGTIVELYFINEGVVDWMVSAPPLVGTLENTTTTATVTMPPGYTRGFVRATWDRP